jgi:hypothetical protein
MEIDLTLTASFGGFMYILHVFTGALKTDFILIP